jgi:uncharacterized integral membrane protein
MYKKTTVCRGRQQYTKDMKTYFRSVFPSVFFGNPAYWRGFTLAAVYLFLAIMQLFTYEQFADITAAYGLAGGKTTATALAFSIPLLEVLSLPFLLSMKLAYRWWAVSRVATLATAIMWLFLALILNIQGNYTAESGLFGGTLLLPVGTWMVLFTGLLVCAVVIVIRELPHRLTSSRGSREQ